MACGMSIQRGKAPKQILGGDTLEQSIWKAVNEEDFERVFEVVSTLGNRPDYRTELRTLVKDTVIPFIEQKKAPIGEGMMFIKAFLESYVNAERIIMIRGNRRYDLL